MPQEFPPMHAREVAAYLANIAAARRAGGATEHTYRGELEKLLRRFFPRAGWRVVNEPARVACGAPDLAVLKNDAAVGFVETKDVGADLDAAAVGEQLSRYRAALPNLILTDYLEFRHYADGKPDPVAVARVADAGLKAVRAGADDLAALLNGFRALGESGRGESPSAEKLAQMMAGKTRLLREVAEKVAADPASDLAGIYRGLREYLIPDLKLPDFADIFAQTAAYGLFAARLEAERRGAPKFSRLQAGELLPQTTPFLRRFFNAFAGADLDDRLRWMADDLAGMFAVVSLDHVVRAFNPGGGQADDPFLHFYETFLREYDPGKRRARGVYFTPRPVVDFIVRAVDHCLTKDFGIPGGLADAGQVSRNGKQTHQVQILDPAAGTGAFLAGVVELVRDRVEKSAGKGGWEKYVPEHLLPRLHGFEILMSAYAMCHLKMSLALGGRVGGLFAKPRSRTDLRVNVFLTNALETAKSAAGDLPFLGWLRDEALAADRVKNDTPVMVVLGNPPYNVSSQNRGDWISEKLRDYKEGLDERHINLDDDYVKFIRNAEHYIEKNGRGAVAMITNNSFLDGVTHRRMREHLLGTFDIVRIVNLHGDAKKKERAPDGGRDQNVFNIMQGVGIFILAKTGKPAKPGTKPRVFYASCQGARATKHEFLSRKSVDSMKWRTLRPVAPYYFFTPKNFAGAKKYNAGVSVAELFRGRNSGIQTKCDELSVHFDWESLRAVTDDFAALDISQLREKYPGKRDSSGWTFRAARAELAAGKFVFAEVCHRPFDMRKTVYTAASGGFIGRSRDKIMRHLVDGENIALLTTRTIPANQDFTHAHASRRIVDIHACGGQTYVFPLWVWENGVKNGVGEPERHANFNREAAAAFAARMGMRYAEDNGGKKRRAGGVVSPELLFDYIYAVLHRPSYRREFAEFLRIDYPRIPPAADERAFRRLAKLGGELRALHLLEAPMLERAKFPLSADGDDQVDAKTVRFAEGKTGGAGGTSGRVYINAKRHFAKVPRVAWDYCVGGYYPAQKWLKDRDGRSLSFDDQRHYCKLLAALARTAEVVKRLDRKQG